MLNRPISPYLLILFVGLLAHGLLLFNDGHYGDGWFLYYYSQKGQLEVYQNWLKESGSHGYSWIHEVFGKVPIFLFKFIMFISLLINSALIYFLLIHYSSLRQNHALFIALSALVWPFYHVIVNITFFPVLIVHTFFYAGWLLYLSYKENKNNLIFGILSILLIYYSFFYKALLIYHFVLLGIYFLHTNKYPKNFKGSDLKTAAFYFAKNNWILLALPFIFWAVNLMAFMPSGTRMDYNVIHIFSFKTVETWIKYIKHIILDPFEALFVVGMDLWYLLIPVLILGVIVFYRNPVKETELKKENYAVVAMILGVLMIGALGFPFSAVGKYPDVFLVSARHGMLAGSGFGLFLVGLIHFLIYRKKAKLARWENFIYCQIILCFIIVDLDLYASWQARWAKDLAISENLSRQGPLNNTSIYFLRDNMPLGVDSKYEYNDVTFILNRAWGGEKNIGISPFYKRGRPDLKVAREVIENWHTGRWRGKTAASHFNPEGCVGEMIVNPKTEYHEISIGFLYLYYKIFRDSKHMKAYLGNLVSVELRSLNINSNGNACA